MRNLLCLLVCVVAGVACSKEKVPTPSLEVTTAASTYKAGEMITFNLTGDPDNITFYSGEPGHHYDYRYRTRAENDLQISFKTLVQFGKIYPNLQLLVSADYRGEADTAKVRAATWKDISSRAVFSAGQDNTASGTISLKAFADPKDSTARLYVAFRYTDYKKTQGQNRWVISAFDAGNVSQEGMVSPLATMATAGWQAIDFRNKETGWMISATRLLMPAAGKEADDNEDWIISKGLDPGYIKPDAGVAIKNISTALPVYKYTYTRPGSYKVVFEGANVRYNGAQRTTREITLTITP
ncbi:DUF5017 domain-containing protein [Chitinophaga nivalis]|uniref:DUF5017 domain-containing protein n=1 Tax=Chitinophaga nivalis TaxID=2991709 RepID=A0ABT3IJQ5_9BACT|nr:DUF5017 domain-containing protein [Chitinophaga nivalis]MCW3466107.1 DUF5017 domain-containing protein [Chitinophaga nivalis]MCW3484202.1 DUF5017 domain-containing protein [Chitinophaga nivalis]